MARRQIEQEWLWAVKTTPQGGTSLDEVCALLDWADGLGGTR